MNEFKSILEDSGKLNDVTKLIQSLLDDLIPDKMYRIMKDGTNIKLRGDATIIGFNVLRAIIDDDNQRTVNMETVGPTYHCIYAARDYVQHKINVTDDVNSEYVENLQVLNILIQNIIDYNNPSIIIRPKLDISSEHKRFSDVFDDDDYIREVNSAYLAEEEELMAGTHPSQIIPRIEKVLSEMGLDKNLVTMYDWIIPGPRVAVNYYTNLLGIFNYETNEFEGTINPVVKN